LIAAELFRSEYAHQTLTESTAALKQLNESYTSMDGMLASSRDLLGTLLRSQKSDTWYLQTAMYMLMVTGAWLLFRRILYGPMWWLVWLPLRIVFGVGSRAGSEVMGRGAAGESGKAGGVGGDGKASVEGLPSEDLPTARVGQKGPEGDDADSMIEKVARVVEDAAEDLAGDDVDAENQLRNTKKRTWEEPEAASASQDTQQRDEL
jgi:protein transport protein SEC20